jgi:hypothetical protein
MKREEVWRRHRLTNALQRTRPLLRMLLNNALQRTRPLLRMLLNMESRG